MYVSGYLPYTTTSGYIPGMPGNRIRELRIARRLSQTKLAQRLGAGRQTIVRLETGEQTLSQKWMDRLAAELDCDPSELLPGAVSREIPVKGYVGAGAEIFPIDDFPKGDGLRMVKCPAGLDPESTVAVEVRGDSMLPIEEGWVLFFTRAYDGVPVDAINRLCVVQVADDGPMLLKRVRRGYTPGRYNLESTNASLREDVPLKWASKLLDAQAPERARPRNIAA